MMRKKIVLIGMMLCISFSAIAEEGMWLPSVISKERLHLMKEKGFKLSEEDIYNVNAASLKDAIVSLGGCTGELISNDGLMITNHHCGYGNIQAHSTVENDYLTNGFWAMSRSEELPNPGYSASFLVRMDDVTTRVLKGIKPSTKEDKRAQIIKKNIAAITASATKDNGYKASVESLYYGNQYFLFVYEKFTDVRLVGAPPSAIGKFGGDTDNWMWPRHTGDFSLFRIYANANNQPADYSPQNVPYKPKRSLTISTKGVNKGDFTFIYGYPGRTNEYATSSEVRYIAEVGNPHKIALRTIRLDVMNRHQALSPDVRIKYASKNASVANAWKKWQGEQKGIVRLGVVEQKRELERQFKAWAADKPMYSGLTDQFEALYGELEPLNFAYDYYSEALRAVELINFASSFYSIKSDQRLQRAKAFYKNYYLPIDLESAKLLLESYVKNVPTEFQPSVIQNNSSNIGAWVQEVFKKSIFADSTALYALLEKDEQAVAAVLNSDIATMAISDINSFVNKNIFPKRTEITDKIKGLFTAYMRGLMEMQPQREFYPDANSTLRIAYGTVDGFKPQDGVEYLHLSTLEGVMAKDNPEIYDYDVPLRLKELYAAKDYGRWAVNGTVPVAFIATNHTTGGNSGSPVLNGDGELLGVNFDRCWESTMSDIVYDENYCRNIAVDIRFVLFIIDKFAGATYLLDEMDIK